MPFPSKWAILSSKTWKISFKSSSPDWLHAHFLTGQPPLLLNHLHSMSLSLVPVLPSFPSPYPFCHFSPSPSLFLFFQSIPPSLLLNFLFSSSPLPSFPSPRPIHFLFSLSFYQCFSPNNHIPSLLLILSPLILLSFSSPLPPDSPTYILSLSLISSVPFLSPRKGL